jgi:hypothetical protein
MIVAAVFVSLVLYVHGTQPSPTPFERELPPNYDVVVSAIVRASGNDCQRVCSIDRASPGSHGTRIAVGCSPANGSCANAIPYAISVTRSPDSVRK